MAITNLTGYEIEGRAIQVRTRKNMRTLLGDPSVLKKRVAVFDARCDRRSASTGNRAMRGECQVRWDGQVSETQTQRVLILSTGMSWHRTRLSDAVEVCS